MNNELTTDAWTLPRDAMRLLIIEDDRDVAGYLAKAFNKLPTPCVVFVTMTEKNTRISGHLCLPKGTVPRQAGALYMRSVSQATNR